jgi:hypothetical protein
VIAGLGYLLIARSSILDVTVKGTTRGLGLDIAYQTMAEFLLGHHRRRIRRALRKDFMQVYTNSPDDPIVFLAATELLLTQTEGNERQEVEDKLTLALQGNPPADALCLLLYLLIRDMTDREDARETVKRQRNQLTQSSAEPLKARLPWLYDT